MSKKENEKQFLKNTKLEVDTNWLSLPSLHAFIGVCVYGICTLQFAQISFDQFLRCSFPTRSTFNAANRASRWCTSAPPQTPMSWFCSDASILHKRWRGIPGGWELGVTFCGQPQAVSAREYYGAERMVFFCMPSFPSHTMHNAVLCFFGCVFHTAIHASYIPVGNCAFLFPEFILSAFQGLGLG